MTEKILLIEDDVFHQNLIKDILTNEGYNVVVVSNGMEGLKKIYSETPSLVLVDYMLPDISGVEIVKEVRKNSLVSHLPIIIITASVGSSAEIESYKVGINDYVTKPFSSTILLLKIRSLLTKSKISVSLNPITKLPGSCALQKEIEEKLKNKENFAVFYSEINNFEPYEECYGTEKSEEVIKFTFEILKTISSNFSFFEVFHIKKNGFAVISQPEEPFAIGDSIVKHFDEKILDYYSQKDKKGQVPFMTICVVGVSNNETPVSNFGEIAKVIFELINYAKKSSQSVFIMNRRKRI
jgi:two-component system alkaline phosphatase synthesis response regulator PhoP